MAYLQAAKEGPGKFKIGGTGTAQEDQIITVQLPRLRAFDNCKNEGVYQRRLAYAGFACHAYHLAAYITLPHQLGDRE
jgi:hypothetical protein